jgi:nucleotide-binding universal stress UspA family protein
MATKIVGAITNDSVASAVLATARTLADLCSATVEALHAGDADATVVEAARNAGVTLRTVTGTPVEVLVRAARADEVVAIVLGAPGEPGSTRLEDTITLQLIATLPKPAVVVPRKDGVGSRPINRILVPLDGTAECAAALDGLVRFAHDAAVEIVVAHVYEAHALPAFSDQIGHEVRAWSDEFIARNCPGAPDAALELRVGEPHEHLLDILRGSGCDLVALGWNQDLARGHAAVVRRMLAESPVPVLLIPAGRDAAAWLPATDGNVTEG